MASSRTDRSRSQQQSPSEKTLWEAVEALRQQIADLTPSKSASRLSLLEQIPIGGIIAWDRAIAAIPENYQIVTEALGRYLRGVATAVTAPGATGGALTHKHAVGTYVNGAITAGTPAGTIDNHTTTADTVVAGAANVITGPITHTFTGTPLGTHNHVISGESAEVNHEPPHYDIVWIRRIA